MRYVIAACPLTKLFLDQKSLENQENPHVKESWQDRCMRDYTLVENVDETFEFEIKGGDGAKKFSYMSPQLLMPTPNSTIEAQFETIAGGQDGLGKHEYDIYGVVPYDIGQDVVQKMHELAHLQIQAASKANVKAKIEKISTDIANVTKIARDKAIKMSWAKVRRAISRNHRYLDNQWQKNVERGGGKYVPSITERLGAISIRDLIQKQSDQSRNAMTEFAKIMEQTSRKGM